MSYYSVFQKCSGVTTDSRHCPPGSLFIALKGETYDGNAFAAQALEAGCAYAFIDDPKYDVYADPHYIVVNNTLETLQQLANFHRRRMKARIIGITGTNGKTTTKELIAAVLSQSYSVLHTLGNLNNHIGVPLTLLRITKEHDFAIVEMGANHPGEIEALATMAEPDYGLITNIGKAHLEGFGSFKGVIRAKGELYDYLRQRENTAVFLWDDNLLLRTMAHDIFQISYGTNPALYVNGRVTDNSPCLAFEWRYKDNTPYQVQTQLIGEYNLPNALAAIATGIYFGVKPEKINEALEAYMPQNNRSQLAKTPTNTLIIDAYNANPTSMAAALENFRQLPMPHKMLILGDMKELGAESLSEHQKIIDYIQTCPFEQTLLVGEQFAAAKHSYPSYPTVRQLIDALRISPPEGKTILIKGSNSVGLNKVVEYL